jgi:hypothetical protein
LPFGTFKAVGEHYVIDPKTVAKLWSSTMIQVNGYQPNLPIDPPFVVSNLATTAFDTQFQNAGRKPKFELETVFQRIEDVDKESRCSLRFVAGAVGMSLSTISRMKNKEKKIKLIRCR